MSKKEMKEMLEQAWKEVFQVEEVKDDDDFFEAGGDSIKGVQIVTWLLQKGIKLEMMNVFTQPTFGELAENLEETQPMYVPEAIVTKEMAAQGAAPMGAPAATNVNGGNMNMNTQGQLCTPEQMAAMQQGQLCTPQQLAAQQQLCLPQQAQGQLCTPEQMAAMQGQLCTPQQMAAQQQLCLPQQAQGQLCTPQQMAAMGMM